MSDNPIIGNKETDVQRHGTMYLISSAGITLVGFLATMFYAHWIGPDILGQYILFLSCFSMVSLLTDLGIGMAGVQRMCEGTAPDAYFTASLTMRMSIFGLLAAIFVLFRNNSLFQNFFGSLNDTGLFWLLLLTLGIATFQSSISMALGPSNRLGLAATVSFLNNLTRILIQVIAVFLGFQIYGLIGGLIAGLLVEILIFSRFIDYHLTKFRWSHIKHIFTFSTWSFLATGCTVLFDNLNPLIIACFLPIADVGIFGVCWTFSIFALFVSTALCNTLFVKVSKWRAAGDWDAVTIALSRATSYALILTVPMLIGGVILGNRLLYYMYGASFAVGATALAIIIGARGVQSILQLYSNFLMATDHVKHQFFGLFAGIVVNIILAYLLIPVWGLAGAAVASLSNVLISTLICRHFLRQIIPIHIEMKTIRDILISGGVMTAIILPASVILGRNLLTTVIMVGTGGVVYLAVLFILNAQIREDAIRTMKINWLQ
jgi:O-antigen/teichoic acid export membrane protein